MGIEFNPESKLNFHAQNLQFQKKASGAGFNIGEELVNYSKKTSKTGSKGLSKTENKTDNLKASNGMTYKEAKATMKAIEQKYLTKSGDKLNGNPYLKRVKDPSPEVPGKPGMTYSVYRFHYEVDANALPEPDRTDYIKAKAAVEEIERNNSALFAEKKLNDPFGLNG